MGNWYLGQAGALVLIPPPAVNLAVSTQFVGSVATSLNGTRTLYRAAQPRQWACQWQALTEDQTTYLRVVGHGLVRGPLRLIDSELRNRLPVRVASGGSYMNSVVDFTQAGGVAATWVAVSDPPAAVPVKGAVSWQRATTAAGSLTAVNADDRVPLVPGEPAVVVSCWARGAAIQAAAAVDAWSTAGVATRTTGTATALAVSAWTLLTMTYTPAGGAAAVSPVVSVASGQAASTLQVTGWQVASSTAPAVWAAGGGAPVVLPGSELTESYLMPGLRQFSLLLLEKRM
jgi:hypothetical protein